MEWIAALKKLLGEDIISSDSDVLKNYASDYTEDFVFLPHAVATPRTTAQVSTILSFCNEHNIPVTPRGAGTGLSGGSLPVMGGVSLSMEHFNKILEIDEQNFQATVECGVVNEAFQQAVKEKGLFYPPDPASKGSCFLGGILRTAAAVPKH